MRATRQTLRSRAAALAAALCAATAPAGCGGERRPHVILISIDTLRADHVGAWGYPRDTTPAIDRLAAGGVRFAAASSPSSWTLPSHMSLMTSQYPHAHGVVDDRYRLGPTSTTLAEALSAAGYETAGIVTWIYVGPLFGFERGFDSYLPLVDRSGIDFASGGGAQRAERVTEEAIRFLRRRRGGPFFLFLHYFDPHLDYRPPEPYDALFDPGYTGPADGSYAWARPYIDYVQPRARDVAARDREHMEALYDGEIRYVDAQLGRLFAAVDEAVGLDSCLVVLLSDHGEELDDHGSMEGHGWTHYEEVLHVPLVVRLPGRRHAGRVVDEPVELTDVAPTVLGLAGIAPPASFGGRSLARFWEEPAPGGGEAVAYAETDHHGVVIRSLRGRRFKLIRTEDTGRNSFGVPVRSGWELYDLERDPGEQRNLWGSAPPAARGLARRLEALARRGRGSAAETVELPEIDRQLLRRLGYVQ